MIKQFLTLIGAVRNQLSQAGLPNLRIEAWDKDNLKDDLVGSSITDEAGRFSITLPQTAGGWNLTNRQPDIYFKIYARDKMMLNTLDNVMWNMGNDKNELEIFIDMEEINQPPVVNTLKTQITGLVQELGRVENHCKGSQHLTVKIFQVTLSSEKLLLTMESDENGMFIGELEAGKHTTLIARLYWQPGDEKYIAESGPHCPTNGFVNIEFKYDSSKYGPPLYTSVKAAVTPHLGVAKLKDLTAKQIKQLLCIACVGKRNLDRLINADGLFDELMMNMSSCILKIEQALTQEDSGRVYLQKALANMQLLSDRDVTESILFALLKNDNSKELHQILTISTKQLRQNIQEAMDDNTIAPISNMSQIIDGFIALRNCILFNSNYDQSFYDAKLIHLSSLNQKAKNNLLDSTIEAGSLTGVMGEEDNQNPILNNNSN